MGAEPQRLRHIMLFPLMAAGHMIPILDVAKLFASHNFKSTIVTTPLNAPFFTKPLESYKTVGPSIDVEIIPFPSKEAGIAEGLENFDQFSSDEMCMKLLKATELLQGSLEKVLEKNKVDCLVADFLYPFATNVAAKFNIPRLVFHGTNNLAQCVAHAMFKYEPYKSVSGDDEEFVIPHLPHEIKIRLSQMPDLIRGKGDIMLGEEWMNLCCRALEAEEKSFGVIVNSFYELEPDYADYYQNVMGRKTWNIGPVSLCNRENEAAKFKRGKDSSIDEYECLKWLDSKKPDSVVYICFGSVVEVSTLQLQEIALGLEASEQDFIWVVRRSNDEEWLPQGFEKRMEGKGIIIKGWAPQVLILDHSAIGAFVTHCGWNSTLEAISYGVPMITWPVFAEQFYNEILVTNILKIGISVGAKEWNRFVEVIVKWKHFKEVIRRAMVGEEALEIKSRTNKIKEMAGKVVEVNGSSYCNMDSLLQELSSYKNDGVPPAFSPESDTQQSHQIPLPHTPTFAGTRGVATRGGISHIPGERRRYESVDTLPGQGTDATSDGDYSRFTGTTYAHLSPSICPGTSPSSRGCSIYTSHQSCGCFSIGSFTGKQGHQRRISTFSVSSRGGGTHDLSSHTGEKM